MIIQGEVASRPYTRKGRRTGDIFYLDLTSVCTSPFRPCFWSRGVITAWERRLIFTIGTSNTTGESDTVLWNEIHHKTEFGSNLTGHGYPDASYLDNVLAELTAQGVSEAVAKA